MDFSFTEPFIYFLNKDIKNKDNQNKFNIDQILIKKSYLSFDLKQKGLYNKQLAEFFIKIKSKTNVNLDSLLKNSEYYVCTNYDVLWKNNVFNNGDNIILKNIIIPNIHLKYAEPMCIINNIDINGYCLEDLEIECCGVYLPYLITPDSEQYMDFDSHYNLLRIVNGFVGIAFKYSEKKSIKNTEKINNINDLLCKNFIKFN